MEIKKWERSREKEYITKSILAKLGRLGLTNWIGQSNSKYDDEIEWQNMSNLKSIDEIRPIQNPSMKSDCQLQLKSDFD